MAQVSFTPLVPNAPENVNTLNTILSTLQAGINSVDNTQLAANSVTGPAIADGSVAAVDLVAALQDVLGVTGSVTRRGKSVIPGQESRTNTAYGLLPTPDRVQSVVLPTDGLICIAFRGQWSESVQGAGTAALFVGANQLRTAGPTGPVVQATGIGSPVTATVARPISTFHAGLQTDGTNAAYTGPATTGQSVSPNGNFGTGGICTLFADAGTYDISVQFKSTSGSVTVADRKLWVWTLGF